jgi:hypothetical protein
MTESMTGRSRSRVLAEASTVVVGVTGRSRSRVLAEASTVIIYGGR